MENFKEKATVAAANWVRKLGLVAMDKWPPDCWGPYYQPQRPARPEGGQAELQAGKKARL